MSARISSYWWAAFLVVVMAPLTLLGESMRGTPMPGQPVPLILENTVNQTPVYNSNSLIVAQPTVLDESLAQIATNHFLSAWFLEVVRLAKADIQEDVIQVFIHNTPGTFNLGVDEIIYLARIGVSSGVITDMIEHDQLVNQGLSASASPTVPGLSLNLSQRAPGDTSMKVTQNRPGEGVTYSINSLRAFFQKMASAPAAQDRAAEAESSGASFAKENDSIIVPSSGPEPDWEAIVNPGDEAPEQPEALYRVRLPYAVKLTDPIVVFRPRRF